MGKRILFCVLHWGLGHASRSAPFIKKLEEEGHEVLVASSGESARWLETELGNAVILLPDYNIHYRGGSLWRSILLQTPKLLGIIKKEKAAIRRIVGENRIDIIISDNRYGCCHEEIPSIFMGHQLVIPTPFLRNLISRRHASYINRFDHCWILDSEELRIGGLMSDPSFLKIPHSYIGFPSKGERWSQEGRHICAILSGPEPQRTILEQRLSDDPQLREEGVELIRGTQLPRLANYPKNWMIHDLVDHQKLSEVVLRSRVVISRSGYSSVWNYLRSGLKAVLIPTPGQYEQVYLAEEMNRRGLFTSVTHEESLSEEILEAKAPEIVQEEFLLPDLSNFFETEAKG